MALDQAGCFSQTPGFCFHSLLMLQQVAWQPPPPTAEPPVCFHRLLPLDEVDGEMKCYALAFQGRWRTEPPP